ncbi:MAG: ATP-binding cassette domain-containing protein [Nitrospirota bacterium]
MIVFDKVWFSYGNHYVLRDLSFVVKENERVAILGGSGEGKTTILKLILGLVEPDSGKIFINGDDITIKTEDELREVRRRFSIVFQEGALFDSLNVKENVAFCLREYSDLSEEEIDGKVREILRIVGMENTVDLMPDELSGGMHRRVAIARSLAACEPRMFLYDEPTTGLDPINADNICRLILDLCKNGRGLIIVTHKVSDAFKVADRFMFLKEGRIFFDGSKDELLRSTIIEVQEFLSDLQICPK